MSLAAAVPVSAVAQEPYDILIRNGRVLDGTGTPWFYADIAVSGDRIVAVGNLVGARARRVVDATGLYVSPGFIDVHTHAANGLEQPGLSAAVPLLTQGITTVVINPDGGGPVDLAEQRATMEGLGIGVNAAQLVPHGSVRRAVLGMQDRAPTAAELERMKELVRAGMEEGAYGMSSGLYYAPGSYADIEEVIALSKVVAEYDGVYTSHVRDEADYNIGVVAALDEVIRIAKEAHIPGIHTHIKVLGPRVWGYSLALVEHIERARRDGIEVWADQYPYEASGTSIVGALVPRWALVGGEDSLEHRIETPSERARLRADMLENLDRRGGADRLQFQSAADPKYEGMTLQEVADLNGMEPVDMAIEMLKSGGGGLVSFNMSERDIELLMQQPWTMTSSDGGIAEMGRRKPHPRFYGAFPRKIRKYVKEEGVIDLATAIRSMTSTSATVFRLKDRGIIRPGAIADIVVFDLDRLTDKATYDDPHHLSEGMVHVLVNGRFAIEDEQVSEKMYGKVLSRLQD
jgi:N-acyl-D-aspartate/D-glutamate deacylase